MKKYLLPEKGNFYKANLHCHSTLSDGRITPEDLKEAYKAEGYSVIAYTDHNILVSHNHLSDDTFLALNGVEMDCEEPREGLPPRANRACHIGFIALSPDNLIYPCYHRTKFMDGNDHLRHLIQYDDTLPDFEHIYSPECISAMMKEGREKGFFVTYNHPTWSGERKEDYCNYHGMHAMEIMNYDCMYGGYDDYNEKEYDEILRAGERIFCTGTDDNHGFADRFGAYTVIKAEKLEYTAITDALVKGNFYASMGPEIYALWFEDGKIHIACSDVRQIRINTAVHRAKCLWRDQEPLTSATFDVLPEDQYVRITLVDQKGYHANTNAYFTDELFK